MKNINILVTCPVCDKKWVYDLKDDDKRITLHCDCCTVVYIPRICLEGQLLKEKDLKELKEKELKEEERQRLRRK